MNLKKPSLADFAGLSYGESSLLRKCVEGKEATLGDTVPEFSTDRQRVRAAFVRFLLLGGDDKAPVHQKGVRLSGAFIEGPLDLHGCCIKMPMCLKKSYFDSQIDMEDAQLSGLLNLEGSYLSHGLNADRLRCSASVLLNNKFKATQPVRLKGAQIGGDLSLSAGLIEVKDYKQFALHAEHANIKGGVYLRTGFQAKGGVTLAGIQVASNLDCSGGLFEVKKGKALTADRANVKGNVLLSFPHKYDIYEKYGMSREPFEARGVVSLVAVKIGASLVCSGGRFNGTEDEALIADRADVRGDVQLTTFNDAKSNEENGASLKHFEANGVVSLKAVKIGADLDCRSGLFDSNEGCDALNVQNAVVQGAWYISQLSGAVRINASHAEVAVLADEVGSWGANSVLDGFKYASLVSGVGARLKWLECQSKSHLGDKDDEKEFRPQPWRHLEHILRDMGHSEEAKEVGIAFQDRLREIGKKGHWPQDICDVPRCFKGMLTWSMHCMFGRLAGYGYRPIDLVLWMIGVWLVCGSAYWWLASPPYHAIAPSDPLVFQNEKYKKCWPYSRQIADLEAQNSRQIADLEAQNSRQKFDFKEPGNWYLCDALPEGYSTFSPFSFSLDLLLPVVDLGQEKYWGAAVATPKEGWSAELSHFTLGHLVRLLMWFQTLFGWLCGLLLVAIVSGYARRNDEGL